MCLTPRKVCSGLPKIYDKVNEKGIYQWEMDTGDKDLKPGVRDFNIF